MLRLCQVLEWAVQHLAAGTPPERFASDAEWRTAVNKRRDAAAPAATFLQDLLQALAQQHVGPPFVPSGSSHASWLDTPALHAS